MGLNNLDLEQLKEIAKEKGVFVHPRHGKDTIVKNLLALDGEIAPDVAVVAETPVSAVQSFVPDAVPKVSAFPTVEEARAALNSHVARGMQIIHMDSEYFHIKMQNRECAGNMKMPLKQLVMQANILMAPTKAPTEE